MGGHTIRGGWREHNYMTWNEIVKQVSDFEFGKLRKIGYFPPRTSTWAYQTLITNETELKKMWDEGANFNYLKVFIEVIEDNVEVNKSEPETNISDTRVELPVTPIVDKGNSDSGSISGYESNAKD